LLPDVLLFFGSAFLTIALQTGGLAEKLSIAGGLRPIL
jgi:hypothetical protein